MVENAVAQYRGGGELPGHNLNVAEDLLNGGE